MKTYVPLNTIPFSNLHEATIKASDSPDEHNEGSLLLRTASLLNIEPIILQDYLAHFTFKGKQLSCMLLSKLSIDEIKQQLPWTLYYEQYITPATQDIKKMSLLELYTALKNKYRNPQASTPVGLDVPFVIIDQYLRQVSEKLALNPELLTCSSLSQMNETIFIQSYPFMHDTIGQFLENGRSDTPTLSTSRSASIFRTHDHKLNQSPFKCIHAVLINAVQTGLETELDIAKTAADQFKIGPETLIRYIACFTFAGTRLSCSRLGNLSAEELKREEPWNLNYEQYIAPQKQYTQNLSLQTIRNALREDIQMPNPCAIAKLGICSSTADKYLKTLGLTCTLLRQMDSAVFKVKYPLADQPLGGLKYTPRSRKNNQTKQQDTTTSVVAEQAAINSDENKIDLYDGVDIDLILAACSDHPAISLDANTTTYFENSSSNQKLSTTPDRQTSKKRKYGFFSSSIFDPPKNDCLDTSDDEQSLDIGLSWDSN